MRKGTKKKKGSCDYKIYIFIRNFSKNFESFNSVFSYPLISLLCRCVGLERSILKTCYIFSYHVIFSYRSCTTLPCRQILLVNEIAVRLMLYDNRLAHIIILIIISLQYG